MDDTRETVAALKRAARRWAAADAAWVAVGCPDMGRNAVEARAIHERADARSILLSAAADFANL